MKSKLPTEIGSIPSDKLKGCFIAGGAVLSVVTKTAINDYDVYPKNEQAFLDAVTCLDNHGYTLLSVSDRAMTFAVPSFDKVKHKPGREIYQVMHRKGFFPSPESIFESFDFTVCMGAYDCDTQKYHFSDTFFEDVASRSLRFNSGTRFPLASLVRLKKYIAKGFAVSKSDLISLALTIAERGAPSSWSELETAIGGAYGRAARLECREEPFSIQRAIEVFTDFEVEKLEETNTNSGIESESLSSDVEGIAHLILRQQNEPLRFVTNDTKTQILVLTENNRIQTLVSLNKTVDHLGLEYELCEDADVVVGILALKHQGASVDSYQIATISSGMASTSYVFQSNRPDVICLDGSTYASLDTAFRVVASVDHASVVGAGFRCEDQTPKFIVLARVAIEDITEFKGGGKSATLGVLRFQPFEVIPITEETSVADDVDLSSVIS